MKGDRLHAECLQLHNSKPTQGESLQIRVVTISSTIMCLSLVGERLNRVLNTGWLKTVMVLLGENKATLRLQEEAITLPYRLFAILATLLIHGHQISVIKQFLMEFLRLKAKYLSRLTCLNT